MMMRSGWQGMDTLRMSFFFFFQFFFFFSTSILSGGNGVLEDGMVGLAASPGPCCDS